MAGNEYLAIGQRAKAEGAEILWGNETAVVNTDARGRSYASAGKTPVIFAVGGTRQKMFLILDNLRAHHSKPVKKWGA